MKTKHKEMLILGHYTQVVFFIHNLYSKLIWRHMSKLIVCMLDGMVENKF